MKTQHASSSSMTVQLLSGFSLCVTCSFHSIPFHQTPKHPNKPARPRPTARRLQRKPHKPPSSSSQWDPLPLLGRSYPSPAPHQTHYPRQKSAAGPTGAKQEKNWRVCGLLHHDVGGPPAEPWGTTPMTNLLLSPQRTIFFYLCRLSPLSYLRQWFTARFVWNHSGSTANPTVSARRVLIDEAPQSPPSAYLLSQGTVVRR